MNEILINIYLFQLKFGFSNLNKTYIEKLLPLKMSNKFIIVIHLLVMLLIIITVIDPFFVYSQENSNDNNPLNTFRDLFNTFKKMYLI